MNEEKELKNDELEKVTGGETDDNSVTVIANAIYHGFYGYVYVTAVYDNRLVAYYGASFSNGKYRYGGSLKKCSVASFCYNYEVNNPITDAIIEEVQSNQQ